jgi:hypothetical protein
MVLSTPHLSNNMARADNCKIAIQGHFDGAAFGMNSMGAYYNPVSISIVDSESKTSFEWSYNATCAGLYAMYNTARLCKNETCGFCTQIKEQIEDKTCTFENRLASEDATKLVFPLDKPSSDNPIHSFSWAKEKFGADTTVLQCRHHLSCKFICLFTVSLASEPYLVPPGQTLCLRPKP